MEDERIIQLFFARDERALAAVKEKYGAAMLRLARNITHSSPDAEEVLSDAYLGAWRSIPPNRPDPLVAYLYKIVRNLACKKLRYNAAARRKGELLPLNELEECIPAKGGTQAEIDERELTRLLNSFLASLDQITRIAFVRRYFYCDAVKDIASHLHMRAHTLTVRLSRTREKFAEFLKKEGYGI